MSVRLSLQVAGAVTAASAVDDARSNGGETGDQLHRSSLNPSAGSLALMPLAVFAHTSNTEFIEKAGRMYRPPQLLGMLQGDGITHVDVASTRFFTYHSAFGWNNQLTNLLYAIDMASLCNRTLIIPPFSWPQRRGPAQVSVARLISMHALSRRVRVIAEDEAGSVSAALAHAQLSTRQIAGEGQPHRKRRQPRWSREAFRDAMATEKAGLISVSCCLMWTWRLPDAVALPLLSLLRYHPHLEAAAAAAAAPLGARYSALHVRRGDKAAVDRAYIPLFTRMDAGYFGALMRRERFEDDAHVYVATDELDRSWFEPLGRLARAGQVHAIDEVNETDGAAPQAASAVPATARTRLLFFAEDLSQPALADALSAFPQPLWPDVLAIVEQIICIKARRFAGSLPSTLSGHIVNTRQARRWESRRRRNFDETGGFCSYKAGGLGSSEIDYSLADETGALCSDETGSVCSDETDAVHPDETGAAHPDQAGTSLEAASQLPLFVKLHESCCDARTARDLQLLPQFAGLETVPCVAGWEEGNDWC